MRFASLRCALQVSCLAALAGCASLPPGSDYPRPKSVAQVRPADTQIGQQFAQAALSHDGESAFRIISVGADGFAARMQMIEAAKHSIDLQYFIFRGDETGRLLTAALLRAAERGVHERILVDDGDTVAGDEQICALAADPHIEVRIFNPFAYRGHHAALRSVEYLLHHRRLDYRMHNKLFVVDNAIALIGGRNIGDEYFQVDPDSQYADDDVFVAGPVVQHLSSTLDEYWNSGLAIPAQALSHARSAPAALAQERVRLAQQWQQAQDQNIDYFQRAVSSSPFADMIHGKLPLVWSQAQVVCDSPHKKEVANGSMVGRLMFEPVAEAANAVRSELTMITPYFVPTSEELQLLHNLRQRQVRVRILTTSLAASKNLPAQSGYMRYRRQLLQDGVELYEVRALLGNPRGSGQTAAISRHGNYGLHAKLFSFDRERVFVGSMNFDQRSQRLNTEVGLIIDSPELAQETAARFEAMTQPANAYHVLLQGQQSGPAHLVWHTQENGKTIDYRREPSPSAWKRVVAKVLSWLPLDHEL